MGLSYILNWISWALGVLDVVGLPFWQFVESALPELLYRDPESARQYRQWLDAEATRTREARRK